MINNNSNDNCNNTKFIYNISLKIFNAKKKKKKKKDIITKFLLCYF